MWHAGDVGPAELLDSIKKRKPLRAVFGNIDGQDVRIEFPEVLEFVCENLKVLMMHIGGYPGKYPARVVQLLARTKPELFICGHSHILRVMYDKKHQLLHINPGACGIHGFHHMRTAVRFVIENGQPKDLVVIELGKRTG